MWFMPDPQYSYKYNHISCLQTQFIKPQTMFATVSLNFVICNHVTNGGMAITKHNSAAKSLKTLPTNLPVLGSTQPSSTLGGYLGRRLVAIGVMDVFSVPGDFNLGLLDHLVAEPGLNIIGCCNEMNAGYAADGYARSQGVGACVVTFGVGGFSIMNAIAGAYSEDLPVICVVCGPNSNDYGANRIIHHTLGLPDFSQQLKCFQSITCYQVVFHS